MKSQLDAKVTNNGSGASPQIGAPTSSLSGTKGRGSIRAPGPMFRPTQASRKTSLKPLHWVKVTRAMQGSLWAESQKQDEAIKYYSFFAHNNVFLAHPCSYRKC